MNDLAEEMHIKYPLMLFSIYTHQQHFIIRDLGEKLLRQVLEWQQPDGTAVISTDYFDYFWLWTLGAYETIRTMDQHRECFSDETQVKLSSTKKQLAKIRMPFAKQELQGKNRRIYLEAMAVKWGNDGMTYEIEGDLISSSQLIENVLELLSGISRNDVLQPMPA